MSKYTIVKKDNNGIIVGDISFGLSRRPYLEKSELFLNEDLLIKKRKDNINKEAVLVCDHVVTKIVSNMSYFGKEKFFNKFFEINDISEIMPFIEVIMDTNPNARKMNKKLFTSTFIKSIVKAHYNDKIAVLSNSDFNTVLDNRIVDNDYENLMRSVLPEEADKVLSSDLHNLCLRAFVTAIDDRYYNKEDHMCWIPCINADPVGCQKVRDSWDHKKTIDQYPFITEGYQIYKDGELDKFYVIDCKNHIKSKKK